MGRPTAATLFEDDIRVTRAHIEAEESSPVLRGRKSSLRDAKRRVAETYAKCEATFSALAKHRAEYNCLGRVPRTSGQSDRHTGWPELRNLLPLAYHFSV